MKRCLRTVLFFAHFAIPIAVSAFDSNQVKEEPEGSWEKSSVTSHVYLETTTDGEYIDNSIKPNVSLCCDVDASLTRDGCIKIATNETKMQLPTVYDVDLTSENITMSDKYFNFVIWNPCSDNQIRYSLDPNDSEEKWYLIWNGSLLRPNNQETPILDYHQYCLAWVNDTINQEYSAFCCDFKIDENIDIEQIILSVGLFVSVLFLIVTYIVYWLLPTLRNLHGLTLRGYVGCLTIAYSIMGMLKLNLQQYSSDVCKALAFVKYFSFLASFFWLNVMSFDIWWTFGGFRALRGNAKQRDRKKFIIYSIYAWGGASILTIICAIMDLDFVSKDFIRPEMGVDSCWLTKSAQGLYFYGPMGITIVCNICLFISTALKIERHKKDTTIHLRGSENRRHNDNKQWFHLYLKLFIVMGISWSMEVVSWLLDSVIPKYVWYITDSANALQGLIIFIIFVWKTKIKRLLLKRFGCRKEFSRNSTRSDCQSSYISTVNADDVSSGSGMVSLHEKIHPSVRANCRTRSLSDT